MKTQNFFVGSAVLTYILLSPSPSYGQGRQMTVEEQLFVPQRGHSIQIPSNQILNPSSRQEINCNPSSNPSVNYTCYCDDGWEQCLEFASDCEDIGDGYYTCDDDHTGELG